MTAQELPPKQRGAIKAQHLLYAIAVLPTVGERIRESLSQEEIQRREEEGQELLRQAREI